MKGSNHTINFRDFIKLCKPKILTSFFIVFILSYCIACGCKLRIDGFLLIGALGILSSVGGANVLNNYYDRDIDMKMVRTASRPIPSGRVKPDIALAFGLFLTTIAFIISLYLGLVPLTIFLIGFSSYIFLYTIMAKRRFTLSVFTTAPAVASPIWFGWWIATGELGIIGFLTGLIMVFWGILHFWSLAATYSKDYKRAELPILTVAVDLKVAKWHLVVSGIILIVFSQALFLINAYGLLYLIPSSILNSILLFFCISLIKKPSKKKTWRLFKFSSQYIVMILLMMLFDRLLIAF